MKKRLFSTLLALCLVLALLPGTALAANTSGSCGENLTWTLDSDGTVTIKGTGQMTYYTIEDASPWFASEAVKRVVVEEGVTSIGAYAFPKCVNLETIELPNSLTNIEQWAFSGCTSLEKVDVPESVTWISIGSFDETPWIASLGDFPTVNGILLAYQGDKSDVTIPEGVKEIAPGAFAECEKVTTVSFPDSLTRIGELAFYNCPNLTSAIISKNVTTVANCAFQLCSKLETVTFPKGLTEIGEKAFDGCAALATVAFANVEGKTLKLGYGAFHGCTNLTSVYLPYTVFDQFVFYECPNLKDLYFYEGSAAWEMVSMGIYATHSLTEDTEIHLNTPAPEELLTPDKPETPAEPERPAAPAQPETAAPTSSTVLVNGEQVAFDAYNINGSNYFKLRDLAYVLNGTEKQFEVGWDSAAKAISLTSGTAYTTAGGEMTGKGSGTQTANPSSAKIILDGKEVSLTAYNIGGNNYFKLRDIGQTFDFGIGWDNASKTITIDTSTGYTAE